MLRVTLLSVTSRVALFPLFFFFFFNDTATTEIYTLSLHDALPISLAAWITVSMSALSKFSTMKRPLGGVTGAAGTGGGGVAGGRATGGGSGRPGWRGPTETGGSGVGGSAWTVTVGGATGPMGGGES